jgi:methyltransferase
MTSFAWFVVLIGAVALERLAELVVARRNERWSRSHGAIEVGAGHYPLIVALHTGLLVGALLEVGLASRPFLPALGWPMLVLVIGSQALRWWCIATLGRQWNTRILVIPGARRITAGPYRWLPHPNYVAVVVEGAALPLVHTAWLTAVAFTVLNAVLLRTRITAENRALLALRRGAVPVQ